jgi:uncharacterized paraquat-inducible protein A
MQSSRSYRAEFKRRLRTRSVSLSLLAAGVCAALFIGSALLGRSHGPSFLTLLFAFLGSGTLVVAGSSWISFPLRDSEKRIACSRCMYDAQHLPIESTRCPECGTPLT